MEIPFFNTGSMLFKIVGFILVLFIGGWMLSKIGKGAKATTKALHSAGKSVFQGAAEGAKAGWELGKQLRKEQVQEQSIDKQLRISGKHLGKRTKFETDLIDAKKTLWFGKDGERQHSKKALMTAKRIMDLADDQARMWPSIKNMPGSEKGTRFESNKEEITKRLVQLQFYILELAREIQQEIESEKALIEESKKDAEIQQQEAQGTKRDILIEQKREMESKLHKAETEKEIKELKEELDVEFKKFKEYNLLVQSGLRMLNVNREVYSKIRELGWIMIPQMRQFMQQNTWTGFGSENFQQRAHDMTYVCKKIDDDITAKSAFAKMREKITRKTKALDTQKAHLTKQVIKQER